MIKLTHVSKIITVLAGILIELCVDDILCSSAFGDYTWIWMKDNNQYKVSGTLKEITLLIDSTNFYRLNRFYLINLDFLVEIIYNKKDGDVLLGEKVKITVLIDKIRELINEIEIRNKGFVYRGWDSANN
jgi:DNA-binding LytR/AlgR family response regulator